MPRVNTINNPFGRAQTGLLKYILMHPGCNANEIWQGVFADKNAKYVYTLLHENRDYIHKTESVDRAVPTTYKIRVAKLGNVIDIAHYVQFGIFKAKYVQAEIPFTELQTLITDVNGPKPGNGNNNQV